MPVLRYRKLPVEIEAVQFDGANVREIAEFLGYNPYARNEQAWDGLVVRTLEGNMRVSVGDYVIKGIQGEFYPCKPDIFETTYRPVEHERPPVPQEPGLAPDGFPGPGSPTMNLLEMED